MKKKALISKYEHRLTLKNYSENTIRAYLNGLRIFLDYLSTHIIEEVTAEILEAFFLHCKAELGYSYSMMKQLLASVSFLYEEVLHEDIDFDFTIKLKKPSRIPVVLSVQEVQRLLNSFTNLKHKSIFTLCYSAGLRVGEILNLTVKDIDSDRMQIRFVQGSGQIRETILCDKKMQTTPPNKIEIHIRRLHLIIVKTRLVDHRGVPEHSHAFFHESAYINNETIIISSLPPFSQLCTRNAPNVRECP